MLSIAALHAGLTDEETIGIRNWLLEQLVSQEFAKLEQGGHTKHNVPLRSVFVDLPVAQSKVSYAHEGRSKFLQQLLNSPPLELHRVSRRTRGEATVINSRRLLIEASGNEFSSNLLIGGPGQGKSTLSQLASQLHRAALLSDQLSAMTLMQRHLVESFVPSEKESDLWPGTPLLPLQVVLPDLSSWLAGQIERKADELPVILRYIQELPSSKHSQLSMSALVRLLNSVPALLVFDGFDEVGAAEDRKRLVSAIRELIFYFSQHRVSAQVIATTRPQGYAGELEQIGIPIFQHYLLPLTKSEAMHYAQRLIDAKINGADDRERMLKKITDAANDVSTARLLTTPLQVTILTALVQQMGRAPRERWNLFNKYFEFTYDREIERETYASALLAAYRRQIELIHARVGILLQIEAERDGGTSAKMPREKLIELINQVLIEDGFKLKKLEELTHQIAIAAENRLVFLVEPEPGYFGFEIRSLQEFMAAWALTTGTQDEIRLRAKSVARSSIFRNVLLFVTSRLYSDNNLLREAIPEILCSSQQYEENLNTNLGAILALEILEEGAVLSQPRRARALMEEAIQLLNEPPSELTFRLASVANEDTFSILVNKIDENFMRPGVSNALCDWVCLIHCTSLHGQIAEEIAERHWDKLIDLNLIIENLATTGSYVSEWFAQRIESESEFVDPYRLRKLDFAGDPSGSWSNWISIVLKDLRQYMFSGSEDYTEIAIHLDIIDSPVHPPPDRWKECVHHLLFELMPSAKTLHQYAEICEKNTKFDVNWPFVTSASWPIVAIRMSIVSEETRTQILQSLKSGELGDTNDWLVAQANWQVRIKYKLNQRSLVIPWHKDLQYPPLLTLHSWVIDQATYDKKRHVYDILLSLKHHARHEAIYNWLSRAILFCIRYYPDIPKIDFDDLKESASKIADSVCIVTPRPRNVPPRNWLNLVEESDFNVGIEWAINPAMVINATRHKIPKPSVIAFALRCLTPTLLNSSVDELNAEFGNMRVMIDRVAKADTLASAIIALYFGEALMSETVMLQRYFAGKATAVSHELIRATVYAVKARRCTEEQAEILIDVIPLIPKEDSILLLDALTELRWALGSRKSTLRSESLFRSQEANSERHDVATLNGPCEINPVWIENVEVSDIGKFKKFNWSPSPPRDGQGQWILILGENGAGKSTLLRSIVVALRNVRDPSLWPSRAFTRDWLRMPVEEEQVGNGRVRVKLGNFEAQNTFILSGQPLTFVQSPEQNSPSLIPIYAYGCRRGSALGGPERQVDLTEGLEVFTLMDDAASLVHAETWIKDMEGDALKSQTSRDIFDCVVSALCELLGVSKIWVESRRVMVREKSNLIIPFAELSDGYLTSAGWFIDLIARWIDRQERIDLIKVDFLQRITGLVLIDEIDLHLHPKWQTEIIKRTRELLPRMSFVVTTHNPLTLVGSHADEIWVINESKNGPELKCGTESPILMTGGQIYRRYFGMKDVYPVEYGRAMERLMFLSGLDDLDRQEMSEIEHHKAVLIKAGIPLTHLDDIMRMPE